MTELRIAAAAAFAYMFADTKGIVPTVLQFHRSITIKLRKLRRSNFKLIN